VLLLYLPSGSSLSTVEFHSLASLLFSFKSHLSSAFEELLVFKVESTYPELKVSLGVWTVILTSLKLYIVYKMPKLEDRSSTHQFAQTAASSSAFPYP
jgi:hypothetical protein